MKNLTITLLLLFGFQQVLLAQTNVFPSAGSAGVGTLSPDASAIFEMQSTSQGVLVPRMTKTQRDAITAPAMGLLIYQTNSSPGFYYFNGSMWVSLLAKGANLALSNLGATTSINTSLIPNADNSIDLGSSTRHWNEAYVQSIKFLDGTTQSTASVGGTTYTAGTGLNLTGTTFSLNNTTVTPGLYGSSTYIPQIVVDAQGRVTSVSEIAATAGTETDPQVGANTTNKVPRWDGTALVTGKLTDDGSRISLGGDINTDSKFTLYNRESLFSTEKAALRAMDRTVSLGGTSTNYARALLGYAPELLDLLPVAVDHIGVYGQQLSGGGNGAGVFATTLGNGSNNYALVAQSSATGVTNYALFASANGAGSVNRGLWVEATGASIGNYALVVPEDGGTSGFGWNTPNSIVGIKQNGSEDPFRIINEGFTTDFIVDEDGRVGIGMDPTAFSATFSVSGSQYIDDKLAIGVSAALTTSRLTVSGIDETVTVEGTNPYVQLQHEGDNIGYIRANGVDFQVATNAENDLGKIIFRTNANTRMYINSDGDIVMGSAAVAPATGYKLSVDGKVMCEEVRVQMSPWPDYVFHSDYQLPTIDEVAKYIQEYQHLPGIPSAQEIESNGLELGEMQAMLMEKVEELTLYIIELQERIQVLESEVNP